MKTQKHLGLKLDKRLNFRGDLEDRFAIANKVIGMLKKLNNYISRHSLVTLYKSFKRPHLHYAGTNIKICDKIESLQYNPDRAITGAIRVLSKENCAKNWTLNI